MDRRDAPTQVSRKPGSVQREDARCGWRCGKVTAARRWWNLADQEGAVGQSAQFLAMGGELGGICRDRIGFCERYRYRCRDREGCRDRLRSRFRSRFRSRVRLRSRSRVRFTAPSSPPVAIARQRPRR